MTKYNSKTDVWTRKQASDIDDLSSSQFAVSSLSLMEEAGKAVSTYILDTLKYDGDVVVLCGLGNNGGDGLVAAGFLMEKD